MILGNKKFYQFKSNWVLVTGGSKGIGEAVAKDLLKLGANVIITGTSRTCKGWWNNHKKCKYIAVNFLNSSDVDDFLNEVLQLDIHFVINNAGQVFNEELEKIDSQKIEDLYKINFHIPIKIIKLLLPKMKESKFGRIVNVISIAASNYRKGSSIYSSSKSALLSASKALALEFAENNILINNVSPGYTNTGMINSLPKKNIKSLIKNVPLERLCEPNEVSKAIMFLLNPDNNFITGHNLIIDGGLTLKQ